MAGLNTALDYLQSSMYTPEQQAEQSMLAEQARLSDSGLRRGILRGMHTTPALLANAAGQVVEPLSTGLSQPLFDYAQGEMQQAQQIPSLVPSYENVTGLRSGMRYVGEKIGENLPNMLVTAPFGVAGRVGLGTAAIRSPLVKTLAGASVGALPLQMGEMTQSMREDPAIMASTTPLERLGRSTAYGVITAPMEAADEALMLARGTGAGKAVKNIFKDGIKQGAKAAGARLIGAVPEAALTEGVPEVAQEATQHAMLNKLNPSRDASKDTQQLKEAFFGGWAAGGGTSVAGRGAEVAWSNARGMQQKIGELLSAKQLPSWLRSADDRTVLDWDAQDDARRTANAEEVAGAMAGDETEAPEFRAQAADWLRRAQEGAAGWQDFAPVAAAREKYHAARKGAERFLAAAKGAWGDLGKEGKNLEFTPDDRIVFDAMRSAMDPTSPLTKDEQRAVGLYNYLKQFLADNRTDVPVHALEDDFGGPEGLQGTLETMRALLQRAGAVQPDATFKERMTAMLADGRQRDLARAKLVLSNLKLEHGGELSPTDAIVMAQRIEDGLQRYPSMTAKQRAAFDKRLDEVFGVNAESVVEALGYQKQRDEVSLAEDAEDAEDVEGQPNPAMQTIFEQQGTARRFIGSAKAEPDDPLHGGLWRLDHPDEKVRGEIRARMARTMRAERGTGNIVRSLNPKQYAEATGVNLEELAQRLKTTVENLEAHPARMLMSDEKLLDKDRIDLSTEDVQRLAKGVVTELSQRVDEDVAANVAAALKQPAAEQRKMLREMGLEHAVKVVRTKDGSVVKSNLAHGGAGRFTVKLQNDTELVLSAQELIKEMRKRVNEPKAKRPGGDADLLRHFAAGISSLLSNPDVASITVNDVWAREHTKERVRKESRAENKEAQNAYAGLVGRFGGYFQLSQEGSRRVTLMQAVRAQERGGDPADYMNVREELENYPTVLLEGHLKRIEGLLQRAVARMQQDAGKKSDGANLRRYRTILDAGRDILDEREEGPEQQNATVFEIQEDKEEEAQRKVRTHQEETDEPLHPHGRRSEKAAPKATGSLSDQRQPMDVPKGVSGKHFTPALRSLEAQVEKLYDLVEGKFQTALDSVLELVAQAADAVRAGDKAKYAKLLAQGQERLTKIAEGMLQRLEERGKAEQNAVKRGALRKEYATVKNVLSKEATSVKDGKIEEAKTLSKEAPKLAAQIREAKPGALGSKENPHSVLMYYPASPGELRPALRKKYAGIKKIAELIASGDRTGTTRNPQQGVLPGHYVTFPGVPGLYRVTGFEKIDLNSPEGIARWEEREGWDRSATKQRFAGQVEHGKLQMVFERAEEPSQRHVELRKTITRSMVREEPNTLFLFGDNDQRTGLGGQAAAMRGEPNAAGVRTKAKPSMGADAFWSDANLDENKKKIDADLARAFQHTGTVVVPSDGLGTGRAQLKVRAPKTFAYLEQQIQQLRGAASAETQSVERRGNAAKAAGSEAIVDVSSAPAFARAKEAAKAAGADYVLAVEGVAGSYASRIATQAKAKGKLLTAENIGQIKPGDVVYLSVPGASRLYTREGSIYGRIPELLDHGAVVRMDTNERAHSSHNRVGEGAVYDRLKALGYYEVTENQHYAEWRAKAAVTHTQNNAQEASKALKHAYLYEDEDYGSMTDEEVDASDKSSALIVETMRAASAIITKKNLDQRAMHEEFVTAMASALARIDKHNRETVSTTTFKARGEAQLGKLTHGLKHIGDSRRILSIFEERLNSDTNFRQLAVAYRYSVDPMYKLLAEKLSRYVGDVQVSQKTDPADSTTTGKYNPSESLITLTKGFEASYATTLLHEGIHAATLKGLLDNPEIYNEAYKLLEWVRNKDPLTREHYAATNVAEFMADTLFDPVLIDRLKNIPAAPDVRTDFITKAWDVVVELVRKLLNLPADVRTALDQFLLMQAGVVHAAVTSFKGTFELDEMLKVPLPALSKRMYETGKEIKPLLKGALNEAEIFDEVQRLVSTPDSYNALLLTGLLKVLQGAEQAGELGELLDYMSLNPVESLDQVVDSFAPTLGAKILAHKYNKEASKPAGETISDTEMQRVKDYVAKVLGPQVATEFVNRLTDPKTGRFEGGSAQWIRKNGQAIIRIVARAANPMSKAHHEAMHEFFQRLTETNPEAADILRKAAGSATVLRQIERFFHAEPNREQILKQLKNSEHERVAYMFQLWAAGELNVGPKTENLFQRIVTFLRKTFGMLNEDERAEAIMAAFHEGKMSEPNAVTQVLAKMNRAKAMERYSGEMKEAYRHVLHWVGTASGGLIGNENPHLDSIGRDFYNETGDKERAAFLIARDQKTNQMMNSVARIYADADKKDMDIALEYLQTGKTPTDPQVIDLVDRTRLMLDEVYDYLEASNTGVKKRKNFFPRVWDVVTLSEQRDQFVADLLQHHAKDLKRIVDVENASREKRALEGVDPKNKAAMKRALAEVRRAEPKDIAEGILSTLLENKGADPVQENEWRVGYTPFMQAANRRVLTWIDDKVFHKYYNKDLVHIMTTYSAQAAHAGEYSKTFGRGGQKLRDKLNEALVWEAVRYAEEKSKQSGLLEQARTFAINGSAGKYDAYSSNAAMKMEIMQFLAEQTSEDPQEFVQKQENALALAKRNIMAMEGTLGHDISEAWRKASAGAVVYENLRLLSMSLFSQFIDPLGVMVNGGTLNDAFNTFKRGIVGVVHGWKGTQPQDEMTALARRIGIIDSHHLLNSMGSLYSSLYLGKTARKWNDRLFRWNGVEMFTQQSRVGAMETGIELILHHLKQTDQEQSKRFLNELGLKPEDKRLVKGDELDYTSPEIQQALMRFVDRSIVRPNAAIRPAYGSDPRAQILFHMKGFTYAFHKVILEKIAHEAKHGNYDPAFTAVLAYVPVMIAADTVRGLLSTGGDEPDWKKKWTLGDYVTHGVERAGLLGIPQLALDTVRWGPTELTGPASEQIVRAGRTVSKEMKQHERLQKRAEDSGKELDKLLAESDDPVYDASRRILRDALPLGTITKNLLIDQPIDSSRQGLSAAKH